MFHKHSLDSVDQNVKRLDMSLVTKQHRMFIQNAGHVMISLIKQSRVKSNLMCHTNIAII